MWEHPRRGDNGYDKGDAILVNPLAKAVDDAYRSLWRERAVPELLWIAELLLGRELREGFRLGIAVASSARAAAPRGEFTLFAAAGSYAALDGERFETLRQGLAERQVLAPVAAALGDLVAHFPAYPLAPLAAANAPPSGLPTAASFRKLRERLETLDDPCSRISLRVQLVVLWQAVQAGVLRGGSTAQVAELAHASRFPLTTESANAARQLLGLASQLLQLEQLLPPTSWPGQFWSRFEELERDFGA
jgi:hypothetical protein